MPDPAAPLKPASRAILGDTTTTDGGLRDGWLVSRTVRNIGCEREQVDDRHRRDVYPDPIWVVRAPSDIDVDPERDQQLNYDDAEREESHWSRDVRKERTVAKQAQYEQAPDQNEKTNFPDRHADECPFGVSIHRMVSVRGHSKEVR